MLAQDFGFNDFDDIGIFTLSLCAVYYPWTTLPR